MNNEYMSEYSEDYKHFDNLIWQVPTWCTAIFTGTIVGLNEILNKYNKETWGIDQNILIFLILFCGFIFLLSFSYALYRYRVHQLYTKKPKLPELASTKYGAQTVLQFSISLQSAVLIGLSVHAITRLDMLTGAIIIIVASVIITYLYEADYYKLRKTSESETN